MQQLSCFNLPSSTYDRRTDWNDRVFAWTYPIRVLPLGDKLDRFHARRVLDELIVLHLLGGWIVRVVPREGTTYDGGTCCWFDGWAMRGLCGRIWPRGLIVWIRLNLLDVILSLFEINLIYFAIKNKYIASTTTKLNFVALEPLPGVVVLLLFGFGVVVLLSSLSCSHSLTISLIRNLAAYNCGVSVPSFAEERSWQCDAPKQNKKMNVYVTSWKSNGTFNKNCRWKRVNIIFVHTSRIPRVDSTVDVDHFCHFQPLRAV